ncbi:peptidoglycan-associated lipoprotein Pal [Oceanomicrobium pacificus]|uniref:Peptidoglycan-associated lipoprotein n=1 Tax=Oceanomicrobium pacificus TaxID=2692916 RepID=A0A6B0TLD6_9RHOB|nr:peptidoglycan-associated lipoprotein Pal [Oceanomicrobium pacificus]MXU65317.1 peptidoglycan-associated lipoprotein Pal [Oceanomicrobium pacificus]
MNAGKLSILAMAGFLAACSNQSGVGGGGAGGVGGAGGTGVGAGDIEESSIAYFQTAVGDRVLFEVDQATLNDAAISTLNGQARWLTQNPSLPVLIEGHADEQGTREYNLALGARRASAVRDYLVSQGVLESRIRIVTYGKERPLEICSEEACWARNRRAVTVVSAGATS